MQPTPNVEEETADHSARVEEDSGEADSVSASEHSPHPLNTGAHAPGSRRDPDRTMSLFSYVCRGWSMRPGWAVSRRRLLVQHAGTPWTPPASPRKWISPWHSAVEPPVFSLAKRAAPKPKKKGGTVDALGCTRYLRPQDPPPAPRRRPVPLR